MRVLVLSQHYWPEPLPKAHEIAEGLHELGHDVTVVTGFPNYPSGRLYPGHRIRPWTVEALRGVKVIRVALYPDHSRSAFHRILNYLSFAVSSAVLAPSMINRPDVILAIHPPLTVGPRLADLFTETDKFRPCGRRSVARDDRGLWNGRQSCSHPRD
jgi:hypothetical protein